MQLSALAASLLLVPSAFAAGLYTTNSPVLQVDSRSYETLIGKSNYTSIVEFYAPWCGHCKKLQPAYEKAAKNLAGLAKVAAVNCDDESNKPFCGSMGVQGFPTLKIVKPGRVKNGKKGKAIVEDYQGPRTAKDIVDALLDKIPNHVKRLADKDYQSWLEETDGPKAILFSDKSTTSATLKAIAVDFLGGMSVGQVRNTQKVAIAQFGIEKFPTLILLPGSGQEAIKYDGEMKKGPMVAFLSQAVAPNPEPSPSKPKATSSKSKDKAKASKASSSFAKASASQASKEGESAKASQTMEELEEDGLPTESPSPNVVDEDTPKPVKVPELAPAIPSLADGDALRRACLNSKSGTCVLVFPSASDDTSAAVLEAISHLSEVHYKHVKSDISLFPFYQLPAENAEAATLRRQLSLTTGPSNVDVIAVNGKRGWYRHYSKAGLSRYELEEWIDAIRMGDGAKSKLPEGIVVDVAEVPAEKIKLDMNDPEGVREALKEKNFMEGVDFEMEEIDDNEYERLLAEAKAGAAARKLEEEERDEL